MFPMLYILGLLLGFLAGYFGPIELLMLVSVVLVCAAMLFGFLFRADEYALTSLLTLVAIWATFALQPTLSSILH